MTREDFLTRHWSRYPPMPEGASAFGRFVSCDDDGLRLRRGADETTIPARGETIALLVPGDLIAVGEDGAVTLLAPAGAGIPRLSATDGTIRDWNRFLRAIRAFFDDRGFLETPTPGLVPCPGTEPTLDVFATEFAFGSRRKRLYLPTSPELHLKKALAAGLERIYEIKTCYRNGEITAHHQPEFTMLEWYRAYEGPDSIARDLRGLVDATARALGAAGPARFEHATMSDLFERHAGARLSPGMGLADYEALARANGIEPRPGSTIDDVFFLIFLERIEAALDPATCTIVDRWPPFQAALARLTPDGWADRFEAYWRGLELANAFHELNDPAVQRERFAEDLAKKRALGKEAIPLDDDFLKALDAGMPPSAGIALGLDRLFMALTGIAEIADARPFPIRE